MHGAAAVHRAVAALAAGQMVMVVDDADREDEGDLVMASAVLRPDDLRRPGHVFPLRAREGGVLVRAGHTEAAVDLMQLSGNEPVAVIGEIVTDDGSMADRAQLLAFAEEHGIPLLDVADLVRHGRAAEQLVEHVATSAMPTVFGEFRAEVFRNAVDGTEHLALVLGDVAEAGRSESGAVVYLRGHEGRGIALGHKIRAYALQEEGMDTVDAHTAQGLPVDSRSYDGVGAQILCELGIGRLRLITNNPAKYGGLDGYGLEIVGRVAHPSAENPHNGRYLRTKRERMGHHLGVAG